MVVASATPPPPPPPPAPARLRQHPPYKEMIVRAVGSLNEKHGSSSRAIAKFITNNYSGLPLKHGVLVKRHLRRLKKRGVLLMVKLSYMIAAVRAGQVLVASVDGAKRKPGRPRKVILGAAPALASVYRTRKPGRPPKINLAGGVPDSGAVLVAPKRKPGRPPKDGAAVVSHVEPKAEVAAAQSIGKRKRGRPLKVLTDPTSSGGNETSGLPQKLTVLGASQSCEKKKRGRSPKALADATASVEKRRPGRPPNGATPVDLSAPKLESGRSPGGSSVLFSKKRGRPKKISQLTRDQGIAFQNNVAAGIAIVMPIIKRRGRPPKKTGIPKKMDEEVGI